MRAVDLRGVQDSNQQPLDYRSSALAMLS